MKPSFVAEYLNLSVAPGSVDRRNNLVRNVRIVGPRSRNKRKYPAPVLERYAKLYHGVSANAGHHFDPRTGMPVEVPPQDKFGRVVNPRMHKGGLHADLKYNPEHAFAKPFLWACEHQPDMYAFSALHRIQWQKGLDADGEQVAEAVLEVASVDIVSEGGTASTIFESYNRYVKEGKMFPTDPKALAGQFESAGQLAGFLTDLLGAVSFSAEDMAVVKSVLANWTPSATASSASPELKDAIAASAGVGDVQESRRFVKRMVAESGLPTVKLPVLVTTGGSVADLVAGFKG